VRAAIQSTSATFFLGIAYHDLGDYRRAVDFFSRNVAPRAGDLILERFGMAGLPSVMSRTWFVSCLAALGEFEEGTARGEEAVQMAESVDHSFSLTQAYFGLGSLYLRKGDLPKAMPLLERSLQVCQVANILTWFPAVTAALGYAYALSGRVAEALPLLKQAAGQDASRGISAGHSRRVAYLSEAYRLANRLNDAIRLATHALDSARDYKARGQEAWALWNLGEIASHRDPPNADQAENHYGQALLLAEELGMRPLLAHCHLGLGRLYRRTGEDPKAQEHLTTAATMFREMDMRFWLEKAEAELGRLA